MRPANAFDDDREADRRAPRPARGARPRQRPPARAAGAHRRRPAAQPAAPLAARDPGLRDRLALPRRRRGLRGRRRLLRRLQDRLAELERRDRRRLRQGPGGGGADLPRPLHDPHRLLRPRRRPSAVLRTLHDSIKRERLRPALLHRRAASHRALRTATARGRSSRSRSAATPRPWRCATSGKVDLLGEPGTLLGALPDPSVADVGARLRRRRRARPLHRRRARRRRPQPRRRPGLARRAAGEARRQVAG